MLVIIEGIDRVGKTTLAKMLEKHGFIYLKDSFGLQKMDGISFKDYSIGKCDTAVSLLKQLVEKGYNVVMDRLHLTEYVYGTLDRGQCNLLSIAEIDNMLTDMGALLVYVRPENLIRSCKEANKNLDEHNALFEKLLSSTKLERILVKYNTLNAGLSEILSRATKYDIYFASPFFNPEQVEREERMIKHLRGLGFKVFSPKESCFVPMNAPQSQRDAVFTDNCRAIDDSKMVFAVTDGKDMGTIWEAGYAYGVKKPIAYFAETLGANPFNLMLAQSGRVVFKDQDHVTYEAIKKMLRGMTEEFEGGIE